MSIYKNEQCERPTLLQNIGGLVFRLHCGSYIKYPWKEQRIEHRCKLRMGHKGKHECKAPGCDLRWGYGDDFFGKRDRDSY